MPLYQWKAYVLLVLPALFPICFGAVDFTQCLADVTSCATNASSQDCVSSINISNTTAISILRTSDGSLPNSIDAATGLTLAGCVQYCGEGQEPFSWTLFAQEYSAWLLPYLALLSQLPFGARRRMDNLMSAILTLGSPTLAGYSLFVTLLNARWVNDQLFADIDYPSAAVRRSVVQVLSSLQQVPLRVHPGKSARFESLVVHPDNDEWWTTLAEELDYSHTWSIASAISVIWVVIAFMLSVANSLANLSDNIFTSAPGTGSVWLCLLPLVVGWLVLSPKCDYRRVHCAYDKASRQVFVADSDTSAAPTHVTTNFGLTIHSSPGWKVCERNITSPDESRIPPIFNYARTLSWSRTVYVTSLHYCAAWQKSNDLVGVDGNPIPGNLRQGVPRENRLGTRSQIMSYCRPEDDEHLGPNILWPRGVFFNMIVASLMSLLLHWGTTSAAIIVVWFTPTIGIGCRTLAYMIYGTLSTVVWILLVSSSILGYYAHHLIDDLPTPDPESDGGSSEGASGVAIALQDIQVHNVGGERELNTDSDGPPGIITTEDPNARRMHARTIGRVADCLRWIGKSLAIINAIGIVAISIFQYAGVFDNCYCDSSVFTWGSAAFNVMSPAASDINLANSAWIGALALALTCCAFFVSTIYLIRDSLPC